MKKIVLIGAGSQNFGLGVIGDIFKSKTLEGSKIFLHDSLVPKRFKIFQVR